MKRYTLTLVFTILLPVWSTAPARTENQHIRQQRERAMDRIVHSEDGIILEIPRVPRLCDRMEIEKSMIDIGDCHLYVEQEGEGIPLVLINGGPGGTHHYFHPHFTAASNYARIIYYDQRGCGLSDYEPGKGYTVDQAVDDLDRLREALKIDQWVTLGFSYGGLLAQCYATKYPEHLKGLILVGSSLGFYDESPSRDQEFISDQERSKFNQIRRTPDLSLAQQVYNLHLNGDWKRQNYYRPSREELARGALYEWVHDEHFRDDICPTTNRVDLEGAFTNCPIPTLILEGKWDMGQSANKPQKLHANHPNARLVIFEESAHSSYEDEPEAFFTELQQFLSNLPKISDEGLVTWKEHVKQNQKKNRQKRQKIPEGPMTEKERAAIEEFYRIKVQIKKGREYLDGSTPLDSLLSIISACEHRDTESFKRVRVLSNSRNNRKIDFDSEKSFYDPLHIFRAPPPPEDAKDGDLWVLYTKIPDSTRVNDAHIFVLWKGNWMRFANMGNPRGALKWHNYIDRLKNFLPSSMRGE